MEHLKLKIMLGFLSSSPPPNNSNSDDAICKKCGGVAVLGIAGKSEASDYSKSAFNLRDSTLIRAGYRCSNCGNSWVPIAVKQGFRLKIAEKQDFGQNKPISTFLEAVLCVAQNDNKGKFSRLLFLERDALFNECGENIELIYFVAGEAPLLPSKSLSDFLGARNLEIPKQTTIYILAPENNSDKEAWNYYGFWDNELKFVVGGSDSIQQNIFKSGLNN